MEKWVLILCDSKMERDALQVKWQQEDTFVHIVSDMAGMTDALLNHTCYLLIIIFAVSRDYLFFLEIIRKMTKAPILILSRDYASAEKAIAIEAGADEYIAWTKDYLMEMAVSGYALIRRFTELNRADIRPPNILLVSAKYSCGFPNTLVSSIIVGERYLDYFTTITEDPSVCRWPEELAVQ